MPPAFKASLHLCWLQAWRQPSWTFPLGSTPITKRCWTASELWSRSWAALLQVRLHQCCS